jgi:MFS family permease
LLFITS